jgi:hypothetical protein
LAAIFDAVVSPIEWCRRSRHEAFLHGFNSIGLILAYVGIILGAAHTHSEVQVWPVGYAAFLPLALGNAIYAAAAGIHSSKTSGTDTNRKLKTALSVTAVGIAIGYIFLAILLSGAYSNSPVPVKTAVTTAAMFLIAFLISCWVLKIVNSQRRSLR